MVQSVFVGIIGLFFISVGIWVLVRRSKIMVNGILVEATVIRTEKRKQIGRNNKYFYLPILKFTLDGKEYEADSNVGYSQPKYHDGEIIFVYIDRNNPKHIVYEGDHAQLFMGIAAIVGGLICIFVAIFISVFLIVLRA